MGEMAALWGYQEKHDMEQLGQKLLCTTLELEKLKAEAVEEMSKNKDYIKQLILLLKYTLQERDEARQLLHKLLTNANSTFPTNPLLLETLKPAKAHSGLTECDSASEAYNYRSPSPANSSFFDGVPSPRIPPINLLPNNQPLSDASNSNNSQVNSLVLLQDFDHESLIIDGIVKGRALPEKGKFLQAVLQSGPLLQTLLVAGPLPRWRNPPQIQSLRIPPVSITLTGCDSVVFPKKAGQMAVPRSVNSQAYGQLSCATAGLGFGSGYVAGLGNGVTMSSRMNPGGYNNLVKRQRFV